MARSCLTLFRCGVSLVLLMACLPALAAAPAATPQPPANAAELLATLQALKASVDGTQPMTPDQIKAALESIDRNAPAMGRNENTIRAAFELVTAYDKAFGPLWVSGRRFSRGDRHHHVEPAPDIHWTIFNVMQAIMDHVYTLGNISRYHQLFAGYKFGSSANFPGAVAPPADPSAVYTVNIDASYINSFKHVVLGEDLPARRPTGAYVAPGAIVTVTIPENLVGTGCQVRVGANSWDMSRKPQVLRLDRVSLVFPLNTNQIQVASPLGGGIYIEVPRGLNEGIVEVSFQNAVRSPFFCSTPYHQTTNQQWLQTERNFPAPWADFQSSKFLMQVPTCWVTQLDDPQKLMADWDKAMTTITDLMGLPTGWGREVEYLQVDLQLRGSAFFPGYPTCNDRYSPKTDYHGYAQNYLVRGPATVPDYPFHEMGHGFMFSKYAGDREAAVNLLTVAVLNRDFGVNLEEAFRRSRGITNPFCTVDTTAITWMMSLHFVQGQPMSAVERQYQLKGHAKYVDVVRLFGWGVLDKFWKSITDEQNRGISWPIDVQDTDRLTLQLSKAAGADLRPLIAFWGIPVQNQAASDAAVQAAGLPESAKVYDLLQKYKSLVPPDNAAFRAFALKRWGHQPRPTGYTTERSHAQRWDHYDAAEAAKVRQRVQDLLDRYFPHGRP